MSLLMGRKEIILEYVSGMGQQIGGNVQNSAQRANKNENLLNYNACTILTECSQFQVVARNPVIRNLKC